MKQKKRSVGILVTTLCVFTLLLAGCAHGSRSTQNKSQKTTNLTLQQTPGTTPTSNGTASPVGNQVYVGQVPDKNAWIGINTDGTNAQAFVTDGSQSHPATFAQWFKGPLKNNMLDITTSAKNGKDHMKATLTNKDATGTVTLANGKSIPFTANAVSTGTATPTGTTTPAGTATPTGTATATGTASPSTGVAPGLYRATGTENGDQYVAGWVVVPGSASSTATPSATGTPSATSTASPSAAGGQQGGAVINQKTFDVKTAPTLTPQDVDSGNIQVPDVGKLKLTQCQGSTC